MQFNYLEKQIEVILKGNYIEYNYSFSKEELLNYIKHNKIEQIIFKIEKLEKWDSTFVVFIFDILQIGRENSIEIDIKNLPIGIIRLISLSDSVNRFHKNNKIIKEESGFLENIGDSTINKYNSFLSGYDFIIEILKSLLRLIRGKVIMRKIDFLFELENAGYKALPIVSLISFMVGLILAFVGSVQMKVFGAQIYVASLVSLAMVRIMGPAMAGVIMAGRTGAAYAATIGTMQVNDEINALKTMGIPIVDFLVLPKLLAITLMMPILSIFADILGILGGLSVGTFVLDIPATEYWKLSMQAIDLKNFLVGLFHGYVYGWVISLSGCYYGIKCGKDADSVGKATTRAVVVSIVWIVVCTGILTFIFQLIGI